MSTGVVPRRSQDIGSVLDDFRLPELASGQPLALSGALAGKRGAVVLFWSGVCSHCVRYDGYFNSFAGKHPEIPLIGVATCLP